MTYLIRTILAAVIILLTACTHHTSTTPAKQDYATCAASCEKRAEQCNSRCRNNCQQCQAYTDQITARHYGKYVSEQYVKGRTIARNLNSYRDPLQCRKVTCNCRADFRICIQESCGGVVKKQLQAAPYCQ